LSIIPPPHFFAAYGGHEANVSIESDEVIEGNFRAMPRALKQGALAHRGKLEDNWQQVRFGISLVKIAGLDDD
jgi:hypothetical protein